MFARVEAIVQVTPPHFRLGLDWNQMLINAGNAAPVLAELDREPRVAIYESLIMQRDVEGLRQLRSKTSRPIALHFGDSPFPVAARDRVCDGFVISRGVLREAAQAAAFNKPFWVQLVGTGLTTLMSLHLGAVLPFAQWPAVNCLNNYADDLLAQPIEIVGGCARVARSTRPGHSRGRIRVDEASHGSDLCAA